VAASLPAAASYLARVASHASAQSASDAFVAGSSWTATSDHALYSTHSEEKFRTECSQSSLVLAFETTQENRGGGREAELQPESLDKRGVADLHGAKGDAAHVGRGHLGSSHQLSFERSVKVLPNKTAKPTNQTATRPDGRDDGQTVMTRRVRRVQGWPPRWKRQTDKHMRD
jgi:hypothetical protein